MAGSNTSSKRTTTSVLTAFREPGYVTGRPSKMTESVVKKLEEAYAIGASDGEACFYADITRQTLTTYQNKHPEFLDRKNALKEKPVLMARQTVMNNIATDVNTAKWYLERKRKDEFSTKTETDTTLTVVQPILGGTTKLVADVHSNPDNS